MFNPKLITTSTLGIITICLIGVFTITSCNKDDNSSSNGNADAIKDIVQNGTWKITKFIDSATDETYHFTGYNFTFQTSGILTAENGTNTHQGSWSITNDDNSNDDDNYQNDLHFNINFAPTISNFEELTDDWHFISNSDTKIELIDVSGGDGSTDYLTFERN